MFYRGVMPKVLVRIDSHILSWHVQVMGAPAVRGELRRGRSISIARYHTQFIEFTYGVLGSKFERIASGSVKMNLDSGSSVQDNSHGTSV
jgi:hypothetical protein